MKYERLFILFLKFLARKNDTYEYNAIAAHGFCMKILELQEAKYGK